LTPPAATVRAAEELIVIGYEFQAFSNGLELLDKNDRKLLWVRR
jgi:hypothetical protein